MNIAMVHYRVGETDGVSLEMDKWRLLFEKMGHDVCYISGSKGTRDAIIVPELHYYDKEDLLLNDECFVELDKYNEKTLEEKLLKRAKKIEDQFVEIIKDKEIDLLIPNNLFCIGRSVASVIGIYNAIKQTDVKVIYHHHDFYWERDYANVPTTDFVADALDKYFPPKDNGKDVIHVVINKLAKKALKEKKGLDADVVPNVFDFKASHWTEDHYNRDFKENLGIKENQIFLLQATRVVNRKAIEVAIDLTAELNKEKNKKKMIGKKLYNGKTFDENTEYVLGVVGMHEGVYNYEERLINHANELGVNMIVKPKLVDHSRGFTDNGDKVYSLWDAYVFCDMITYPSIQEGWGNQFLEGLFAKKPQVVFEYDVFRSDIKENGFNIISLGSKYKRGKNDLVKISDEKLKDAAKEVMEYLTDEEKYYESVEENFRLGKENYSMEVLEEILRNFLIRLFGQSNSVA